MSKELALIPSAQEWTQLKEIALMAVKSGLLPSSIKTPEQAVIIALKGRELGIPPMVAFAQISVINGKPCMSAELMLAQIYKNNPSASISFIKNDDQGCVLEAARKGSKPSTWSFTMEEAKAAGLLGKDVWKKYPAAMLRARAISAMARAMFPDAINGVSYTPEELGSDVEIADDGTEVVRDITPPPPPKTEEPTKDSTPAGQDFNQQDHIALPGQPDPIVNHANVIDPEQRFFTQENVDAYRLTFKFNAFKEGMSFADLGPKDTKQLLLTVQSWRLKFDNEGKPIPPQIKQFIELAKLYLARFD